MLSYRASKVDESLEPDRAYGGDTPNSPMAMTPALLLCLVLFCRVVVFDLG